MYLVRQTQKQPFHTDGEGKGEGSWSFGRLDYFTQCQTRKLTNTNETIKVFFAGVTTGVQEDPVLLFSS